METNRSFDLDMVDKDRVAEIARDFARWQATVSEDDVRSNNVRVYEVARQRYERGERLDASTYWERLYTSLANAARALSAAGQERISEAVRMQITLVAFFDYEARYGHNSAEDEALVYERWNTTR